MADATKSIRPKLKTMTAIPVGAIMGIVLSACSGSGGSSSPVPETVTSPPAPPAFSVTASAPAAGEEASFVQLTANASNGTEPLTFNWMQTSGPEALIQDGETRSARVQIPLIRSAASLGFQVTAMDDDGATSMSTVSIAAEPALPSQILEVETVHDGLDRIYSLYTPAIVPQDAPLVIFLHGAGGNMRSFIAEGQTPRRWLEIAEEEGVVIVIPNGFNTMDGDGLGDVQTWNELVELFSGADDVGFIKQLIDEVAAGRTIDANAVFVGGRSNGGNMTLRLAIEAPDSFRAVAPFLSQLPAGDDPLANSLPTPPMFIFNDTNDRIVPFDPTPITRGVLATLDYFLDTTWSDITSDPAYVMLEDTVTDDGCQIFSRNWADSTGTPTLRYFEGRGGGHNIPDPDLELEGAEAMARGPVCRDINGVDAAWEFFETILEGDMAVSP